MTIFEKAMINDYNYFKTNDYDVNIQDELGKSLLHYAVLGSSIDVVNELIKKGVKIDLLDNENETAFFDCARKAKFEIAKILINNSTDLNISNLNNETSFHLASAKGDKKFIQLLVENGINTNTKTITNKLPIHYAILAGQIDVIKYLLKINNQSFLLLDENNNSLLHYAAQTTNDLMIYFLISEGLNPNLLNNKYETPLFNAIRFGTKETVNALLSNDAYIDLVNINQETAIDYCHIYERYDIETLLTNFMMLPKYERLYNKQILSILTISRNYTELKKMSNKVIILRNDKYNYTALDYAKLYNFKEAIDILKKIAIEEKK